MQRWTVYKPLMCAALMIGVVAPSFAQKIPESEVNEFSAAVSFNHVGTVVAMLRKYPGIVNSHESGFDRTPLMRALEGAGSTGDPTHPIGKLVQLLLDAGADVNAHDFRGQTAIHYARYRAPYIALFLNLGADPNVSPPKGYPVIFSADSNTSLLKLFIAKKVKLNVVVESDGAPMLHHFMFCRKIRGPELGNTAPGYTVPSLVATLKLLLDGGADPNMGDRYGQQALHRTSALEWAGDLGPVYSILLDRGAKVDGLNILGETPLHEAVSFNRMDGVRVLLARGANVNAKTTRGTRDNVILPGFTPLMIAVRRNNIPMAKLLITKGARVNERDDKGMSALSYATDDKNTAMQDFLTAQGGKL